MPLLSGLQGRFNSVVEIWIFGRDAAFEAVDHSAVLTDKELFEVPFHITRRFTLIEGCVGLCGAALGVHLLEQLEAGAVGG